MKLFQRLSCHFVNEWRQLAALHEYNWVELTAVQLSFEIESLANRCELRLILLGVGIVLSYDWGFAQSELMRLASVAYEQIQAEQDQ